MAIIRPGVVIDSNDFGNIPPKNTNRYGQPINTTPSSYTDMLKRNPSLGQLTEGVDMGEISQEIEKKKGALENPLSNAVTGLGDTLTKFGSNFKIKDDITLTPKNSKGQIPPIGQLGQGFLGRGKFVANMPGDAIEGLGELVSMIGSPLETIVGARKGGKAGVTGIADKLTGGKFKFSSDEDKRIVSAIMKSLPKNRDEATNMMLENPVDILTLGIGAAKTAVKTAAKASAKRAAKGTIEGAQKAVQLNKRATALNNFAMEAEKMANMPSKAGGKITQALYDTPGALKQGWKNVAGVTEEKLPGAFAQIKKDPKQVLDSLNIKKGDRTNGGDIAGEASLNIPKAKTIVLEKSAEVLSKIKGNTRLEKAYDNLTNAGTRLKTKASENISKITNNLQTKFGELRSKYSEDFELSKNRPEELDKYNIKTRDFTSDLFKKLDVAGNKKTGILKSSNTVPQIKDAIADLITKENLDGTSIISIKNKIGALMNDPRIEPADKNFIKSLQEDIVTNLGKNVPEYVKYSTDFKSKRDAFVELDSALFKNGELNIAKLKEITKPGPDSKMRKLVKATGMTSKQIENMALGLLKEESKLKLSDTLANAGRIRNTDKKILGDRFTKKYEEFLMEKDKASEFKKGTTHIDTVKTDLEQGTLLETSKSDKLKRLVDFTNMNERELIEKLKTVKNAKETQSILEKVSDGLKDNSIPLLKDNEIDLLKNFDKGLYGKYKQYELYEELNGAKLNQGMITTIRGAGVNATVGRVAKIPLMIGLQKLMGKEFLLKGEAKDAIRKAAKEMEAGKNVDSNYAKIKKILEKVGGYIPDASRYAGAATMFKEEE